MNNSKCTPTPKKPSALPPGNEGHKGEKNILQAAFESPLQKRSVFISLIIFIFLAVAAALVLIYKPLSKQPASTEQKPNKTVQNETVQTSAPEIPQTNPFEDAKTNPFKDIKINPFE